MVIGRRIMAPQAHALSWKLSHRLWIGNICILEEKVSIFGPNIRKELLGHESVDSEEMTLRDSYLEVLCHRM